MIKNLIVEKFYDAMEYGYKSWDDAEYNANEFWNKILEEKVSLDDLDKYIEDSFREDDVEASNRRKRIMSRIKRK